MLNLRWILEWLILVWLELILVLRYGLPIVIVLSPGLLLRSDLDLWPSLLAAIGILWVGVFLLLSVLILTSIQKLTPAIDCVSGVAPYLAAVDFDRRPLAVSIHLEPTGHEGSYQQHANDQ